MVHHTPPKLVKAAKTLAKPSAPKAAKSNAGKILADHKAKMHK